MGHNKMNLPIYYFVIVTFARQCSGGPTPQCASSDNVEFPDQLSVTLTSNSGKAGYGQSDLMGVFLKTNRLYGDKPVYRQDRGVQYLFYSDSERWMIGPTDGIEGNFGGVRSVEECLSTPVNQAYQYWDNGGWEQNSTILVSADLPQYPESLFVSSRGYSRQLFEPLMGSYKLSEEEYNHRPVYQHEGGPGVCFYANDGYWMVGDEAGEARGYLSTFVGGLPTPLEKKWFYYDAQYEDWFEEPELHSTVGPPEYPDSLAVSSSGPAGTEHEDMMGTYKKTTQELNYSPVYQQEGGDFEMWYSDDGYWVMGIRVGAQTYGFIQTVARWLETPLDAQWEYFDATNEWFVDPEMRVTAEASSPAVEETSAPTPSVPARLHPRRRRSGREEEDEDCIGLACLDLEEKDEEKDEDCIGLACLGL